VNDIFKSVSINNNKCEMFARIDNRSNVQFFTKREILFLKIHKHSHMIIGITLLFII
jgi:hypothetical protein